MNIKELNKNQLTMIGIGGVALLAVLTVGWFIYADGDVRAEAQEKLDEQIQAYEGNCSASDEEAAKHRQNTKAVEAWVLKTQTALAAMKGGVPEDKRNESASSFQMRVVTDARRFATLPEGEAVTKIVDAQRFAETFVDFASFFGVNKEGEAGRDEELSVRQRQWADTSRFVEILLNAGATRLESVKVVAPAEEDNAPKRSSKKSKTEELWSSQSYTLVFEARPDALVEVINALAKSESFDVIDTIKFTQENDPLLRVLTESNKKQRHGARSSHRRTEEAAPEAAETLVRSGTVTNPADPERCTPFKVTLQVTTMVFPSVEKKEVK